MKFLCGSCRTKYQISDEKVRGKILTIRCKKCGAKILVRESLAREGSGAALAPIARGPSSTQAQPAAARAGGSASLAAAYLAGMDRAPASDADDMPTSIAPVPTDAGLAGFEWYVAIDGQQHGPFAFAELVAKVRSGDVVGRHYAWHDGMADWTRVRDLADFSAYLPAAATTTSADAPSNVVEFPASSEGAAPDPQSEEPAGGSEIEAPPPDVEPPIAGRPESAAAFPPPSAVDGSTLPAKADRSGGAAAGPASDHSGSIAAAATVPEGASLKLDLEDDDIFANVPRASPQELVRRESTKFFVAAAGVENQTKRNRLGYYLAALVALLLLSFIGLWYAGIVRISLPGIGNPFAAGYETTAQVYGGESEDDGDYELLLGEVATKPVKRRKAVRKTRGTRSARRRPSLEGLGEGGSAVDDIGEFDYVQEDPVAGRKGINTRTGESAPTVSIDSVGSRIDVPDGPGLRDLPTESDLVVPPPDVEALDARTIQRVVSSKKASVRLCYEKSLKAKEKLQGKLQVSLVVEPSGNVARVWIESSAFKGSVVGECIVNSVRNWRFPKFAGGAQEIELPFVFQRGV